MININFPAVCSRLAVLVISILLLASPLLASAQSDAERVTNLRDDIRHDQERLTEVQAGLQDRAKDLTDLAEDRENLENELTTVEEQLEAATDNASETSHLDLRRTTLRRRIALEKRKSEIVFEWDRGARAEIRIIDAHLELLTSELMQLTGDDKSADKDEYATVATPALNAPAAEVVDSTTRMNVLGTILPGTEYVPPVAAPGSQVSLAETAEQIQARKQAKKTAAYALAAEDRLDQFVERKQLLQDQLVLEQEQLELDEQGLAVLRDEIAGVEKILEAMTAPEQSQSEVAEARVRLADLQEDLAFVLEQLEHRHKRLERLEKRMEEAVQALPSMAADAERSRKNAEKAREDSIWQSSPLNPSNIFRWLRIRGERIFVALLAVGLILLLVRFAARKTIQWLILSTHSVRQVRGRRAETLARSLGSVLTGLVVIVGFMVVLREGGVDISTVLGGAAIFGVAVAFGAQNLMKDYFNGLMILLEDQYGLNDLVTIGAVEGRVEQVNMRTTVVRDIEGRLHFIPNGQIAVVTNRSYEWGRAMFDIPVPYECDIDEAINILMDEANIFCEDMDYTKSVADKPEMLGVNEFGESAIIVRFIIKTAPAHQIPVRREMLRRIKKRFDKEGIAIPYPHRILITRD